MIHFPGTNSGEVQDKVKAQLERYLELMDSRLPQLLGSFYLYGSISLGAFKEGFSDIDFIGVLHTNEIKENTLLILKEIHTVIKKEFPDTDLDGFYFFEDGLETLAKNPVPVLRFNSGSYIGTLTFYRNSIDTFQLKKYGITVRGRKIEEVPLHVDWEQLLSGMRENLNTYWAGWAKRSRTFPSLYFFQGYLSLNSIEWGVLGVTRLYYTFRERDITSKAEAGEYALMNVPEKWHKIIEEALRLRNKKPPKSSYNSLIRRRNEALAYMDFMIKECNERFENN
ncbi:aminoglycoside adenylyltransferase domain-containing protein [Peribacillus kribbensis]|uniref:aminoglycoside adenylyltransferase domain-containing protein n=1 Tax=Peribacillus kribbensis TaxID=356658 RepID=UPI0004287316|nr:aminoglycoside adenylyltransferase domain-containing protein [Peribacillus kribbensis]